MKDSKIIAFVATTKPKAARAFYEKTLGLKFVSEDSFALVFDINGTMLRVQKVEKLVGSRNSTGWRGNSSPHTVLGWEVGDIKGEVERLKRKGVRFERYEGLKQDTLGIWNAPSGAQVAWFKDPDGNILSLTQFG